MRKANILHFKYCVDTLFLGRGDVRILRSGLSRPSNSAVKLVSRAEALGHSLQEGKMNISMLVSYFPFLAFEAFFKPTLYSLNLKVFSFVLGFFFSVKVNEML